MKAIMTTLACMEVWGGNQRVTRTIELPEITAWIYSNPASTRESGGDVHYLSVCGQAVLSRVVLADVSGHGDQASASAQVLHALMREHINTWDQTEFVRQLNRSFRGCVAQGRYATAAMFGILRNTGQTAFTNAGHLPPLWYRSRTKAWQWLDDESCKDSCGVEGLPVGLIPGTHYRQRLIQLEPQDILILYTDGISEAEDDSGDMLGRDRLMEWACTTPTDEAAAAGEYLLRQFANFRKENFSDDETIMVIKRGIPS